MTLFLKSILAQWMRGEFYLLKGKRLHDKMSSGHLVCCNHVIVKVPTRFFYKSCIVEVMHSCIIMYNMIVEDESEGVTNWGEEDVVPSSDVAHAPQNQCYRPTSMRFFVYRL